AVVAVGRVARLSRRLRLPLLLFQDTDGYDPVESADPVFLRAMADAMEHVRHAAGPKIAVILGHGHVLGTFVLGGRQLGVDFVAALPWADVSVLDVPVYEPGCFA